MVVSGRLEDGPSVPTAPGPSGGVTSTPTVTLAAIHFAFVAAAAMTIAVYVVLPLFEIKTEHGLNQSLPHGSKNEPLTVTRWLDAARLSLADRRGQDRLSMHDLSFGALQVHRH
jgi:hypothetical protein